ncbi:hypothetical protein CCM_04878 [Cordyceps militaris CM01]|uniref:Uncharacterized protein n=1 Tax=Cordyceps militaris (strain CM01) TaxID=983644 RepID=G3JF64_CORMM|nr:uncharacterized protein CCM_04878 [Cordyceps militaris CM01]EGX93504.1 hypothetical protein CCM_04878 [Cordyceps militaris CM01]
MSLAIWPPVSPEERKLKEAEGLFPITRKSPIPIMLIRIQKNELAWITAESLDVCRDLKHGLEDCYALLAPIDPGSTLVMSTPRNEKVKGTITRVGTRLVKGKPIANLNYPRQTLNLQLRTTTTTFLTIAPQQPIYIPALEVLNTHLTQAVNLLDVTLSQQPPDAATLASSLALLSESLDEATALLKGRPLTENDPTWQTSSCPAQHFTAAASSVGGGNGGGSGGVGAFAASFATAGGNNVNNPISFHIGIQESCIVLWLRVLEPANAPVHFGVKLGLAIGTMRRLEHDEMDTAFNYNPSGDGSTLGHKKGNGGGGSGLVLSRKRGEKGQAATEEVHVREKVRVVSADPSLISLFSKLGFLNHVLGQTRRNLAAVLGSFPQD